MFNTNRGLLKYILLNIITFGIYGIVMMAHISEEINVIATCKDGKHTMHYLLILLIFSWLTLGIAPLVWYHRISNRIGSQLVLNNAPFTFGSDDFWLWYFLGSLIIVGPFIYMHKLLKSMNLLNQAYLQGRQ